MEKETKTQLEAKYQNLLKDYNESAEFISNICQKSRELNRGSFGLLEDNPDQMRIHHLNRSLRAALFSLHILLHRNVDKEGECGVKCIACNAQYHKDKDNWSCQVTCECK